MPKAGNLGQKASCLLYYFTAIESVNIKTTIQESRHSSWLFQATFVLLIQFSILLLVPILSLVLHVYNQSTLLLALHVQERKTSMEAVSIHGWGRHRQYPLRTTWFSGSASSVYMSRVDKTAFPMLNATVTIVDKIWKPFKYPSTEKGIIYTSIWWNMIQSPKRWKFLPFVKHGRTQRALC